MANTQRSELCTKAEKLGEILVQMRDPHLLTRLISGERDKAPIVLESSSILASL